MTPEGKVKAGLKKLLKERGVLYSMHVPTGYGSRGEPDFICCYQGRYIAIETKAPGGKPTPHQMQRLKAISDAGGIAFIEWGVDDCITTRTVLDGLKGIKP